MVFIRADAPLGLFARKQAHSGERTAGEKILSGLVTSLACGDPAVWFIHALARAFPLLLLVAGWLGGRLAGWWLVGGGCVGGEGIEESSYKLQSGPASFATRHTLLVSRIGISFSYGSASLCEIL